MKLFTLESLMAAPKHTLADLGLILAAATRVDHPLASLTTFSILTPGVADTIPAANVSGIDLQEGTVPIPNGREHNDVVLDGFAMDVVENLVGGRNCGVLIQDDHGDPVMPDADASDFAVELLAEVCPETRRIAWDLRSVRRAAFQHMREAGVSNDLLASVSGLHPMPHDEILRDALALGQLMVGEYWTFRLSSELVRRGSRFGGRIPIAQPARDLSFGSWLMGRLR